MVSIRPKALVKIQMAGKCLNHARTDITVRDVASTIDEPVARGGTNLGLTPTETVVAALIGCTNVIVNRIAGREHIPVGSLDVSAEADFDRRGAALEKEIDVPFVSIILTINLITSAPADKISILKTDLSRFCPISKMLEASGTKITEVWNISAS